MPPDNSLLQLDVRWIPVWAASIAALVAIVVATINAWNARQIEIKKAHREYVRGTADPMLSELDDWHRAFLAVLQDGSLEEMGRFLNRRKSPHAGPGALIRFEPTVRLSWRSRSRYSQFKDAQNDYIKRIQYQLNRPPEELESIASNPTLAILEAEVDLLAGPVRGMIDYMVAWDKFRHSLVRDIFR